MKERSGSPGQEGRIEDTVSQRVSRRRNAVTQESVKQYMNELVVVMLLMMTGAQGKDKGGSQFSLFLSFSL